MMVTFRRVWSNLFGRYLWITNTVSSGGLFAIGDALSQGVEHARGINKMKTYNWKRTGRLFLIGLSQGPPHHIFYSWLDKVFPQKSPRVIIKKILVDQIVAAPFFAITFFIGAGILEGKSIDDAYKEFKKKFPTVYLFDWCLWPPSQAVNFYFIPNRYRVLYINGVTVMWDTFLSFMKHDVKED